VFSANLFSYKAKDPSFYYLEDSASALAAVTFLTVVAISPLIL